MSGELSPNLSNLRAPYFVLHIAGGHVGLPVIVLTFILCKNVFRHPTLINFCVTWIIYSVSYCIQLYSGSNISSNLCVVQAAMIHGAPAMTSVAALVVVIQIWRTFFSPQLSTVRQDLPSIGWALILGLPYFVFFIFAVITALFGWKYPSGVKSTNSLYCTFVMGPYSRYAVPMFCLIHMVVLLGFEVAILIRFYRMNKLIHTVFPLADRRTSPSLCLRIGLFTLYCWFSVIVCVLFVSDTREGEGAASVIQASLPLAAVVVFGTQRDLFITWCFWKWR